MRNAALFIVALCACDGIVSPPGGGMTLDPTTEVGVSGIRRLSRLEMDTSIQDIIHPDPVKHIHLIIIYSFVSIFICIGFGLYMKTTAKKISSEVLAADSQLWIIERGS